LLVAMHAAPGLDAMQQRELSRQPYEVAEDLIMGAALIVGIFYSIDALYGERRDRGILFWKSLPLSDLTTVVSKACIPMVVLPLLAFALAVLTQWMMLLISSAALLGSGLSVAPLWSRSRSLSGGRCCSSTFFVFTGSGRRRSMAGSCWSRAGRDACQCYGLYYRPLTIGFVEKIAFNTTHFGALIGSRFTGGSEGEAIMEHGSSIVPMPYLASAHFLINPGLWVGLAVTAAFLAIAVRVRRYRGPI